MVKNIEKTSYILTAEEKWVSFRHLKPLSVINDIFTMTFCFHHVDCIFSIFTVEMEHMQVFEPLKFMRTNMLSALKCAFAQDATAVVLKIHFARNDLANTFSGMIIIL